MPTTIDVPPGELATLKVGDEVSLTVNAAEESWSGPHRVTAIKPGTSPTSPSTVALEHLAAS